MADGRTGVDLGSSGDRRALLHTLLTARGLTGAPEATLTRADRSGRLRLSFGQERLWFLDQLDPAGVAYNVAVSVRTRGELDVEVLRRTLGELVIRHEVLRTTIEVDPATAEPLQRIHPPAPIGLEPIDLTTAADAEQAAERLVYDQAVAPFDLAAGPLWRAVLIRLGPGDHRLGLAFHHLLVDAWSLGVLVAELCQIYNAYAHDRPSPLPPPAFQYADYATWQRGHLTEERLTRQLGYWQHQLAGAPPLDLPADHPRTTASSSAGGQHTFQLPAALTTRLHRLCREEGATLYMALLAAYQTLLSRYSGQTDICVGTPTAGRTRPELEDLVGFFINTLVMRTDLAGRPTFRQLLHRVRRTTLDAYDHQDVPFDRVVHHLRPDRDLDRTPLFQVMFGLQNAPWTPLTLDRLHITAESVDTHTTMFDLMLLITENEEDDGEHGTLGGLLTYRTDLLTHATVTGFADHLTRLLHALVDDPDRPVGDIEFVPPQARRELLATACGPVRPADPACLHELFEAQVRRTPDAVAVRADGCDLTYAELNRRANRLARTLQAGGVGPEVTVGIALHRSADLIAGLIATLKAGGACVPLDLSYPADRLGRMVEQAAVRVLLTSGGTSPLPAWAEPMTTIDVRAELDVTFDARDDIDVSDAARPENLAIVIYTSGSTGTPKGAMVPHSALVNHMLWMQDAFPLGPDDRVLHKTPIGFDASIWEIWAPLLAGARVVMARPGGERDNGYLVRALRDEEITILQVVPGLLDVLCETPGFAECRRLRRVFCGGEALRSDLYARFHAVLPADLINLYGPAEACIDAVTHLATPDETRRQVPIGRPIANVRAYVLDRRMNLVPSGVTGELHLGGAGLARGYLGRPDLTAEAFVPDPYGDTPGSRLYRTGDLARRRPDGGLEFAGRRDRQVKVRGHRVEPTEVETVLAGHPAIKQVVVAPVSDRLTAYAVPHAGHTLTLSELQDHTRSRLPSAMRPEALVVLDELPRTPNGKLDRAALPTPAAPPPRPARPPNSPLEAFICARYATVLGLPQVDPEASFFALGGNSLQAMRLVARLRSSLGDAVSVGLLFQASSPAALADRLRHSAPHVSLPKIAPAGAALVSFAQRRLWLLQQLRPDRIDHNVSLAVRLIGELDLAALRRALTGLAGRHDVLRTRFPAEGSAVRAVVAEPGDVRLDVTDVADPVAGALDVIREPFDLADGPVWRAHLLRIGPAEHVFVIVFHHVVTDGGSGRILLRDLAELYRAAQRHTPAALPALPVSYADYAAWQWTRMAGPVRTEQADYWRRRLDGLRPLRLGRGPAGTHAADRPGTSVPLEVSPSLRRQLAEAAREADATMFVALLAVLDVLLYQETGQTDLAVGTEFANRPFTELDEVVGPFINQVVLRTDLAGRPTFRELIGRVRQTCLEAQAHQDLPFEDVAAAVGPSLPQPGRSLFDVEIVLDEPPAEYRLDDLVIEPVDIPVQSVKHDVTLYLWDDGEQVTGAFQCAADVIDTARAAELRDRFLDLLDRCATRPDTPVSALTGDVHARPATFRQIRPRPVWTGPHTASTPIEEGPR
jgi:amino acid adenylation domain-containing protein